MAGLNGIEWFRLDRSVHHGTDHHVDQDVSVLSEHPPAGLGS
jgi:hypothetical protein